MNKDIKHFGIDISSLVFDVTDSDGHYYQFKNSLIGFKKFMKLLDFNSHCVLEATGYYQYQLAYYLQENSVVLSVENPLSVKRFIQMKLSKIKTDKSDSKLICEYAKQVALKLWQGNLKHQLECLQMTRLLSVYTKQRTMLKNKLYGEAVLGQPSKLVVTSLKRSLRQLKKEIDTVEEKLLLLVNEVDKDVLTRLKSILGIGKKTSLKLLVLTDGFDRFKSGSELCSYAGLTPIKSILGIGKKTSLMLLVLTDGFDRFKSGSELCSYAGLTPLIRQSGSSVNGRARIRKIGNQKLRNLLFMCSFNVCKYNKGCKAIYNRIVAKDKRKKLALIAVCNKLLKQAFAIAKLGLIYDDTYRSTLVKN